MRVDSKMSERNYLYQLNLPIDAVRQLLISVKTHKEHWAGGNPDEQMMLMDLIDYLQRIVLEDQFDL